MVQRVMKNEPKNRSTKRHFEHKIQMPDTEFPQAEHPLELFKIRQKLCQQKFILRIGIKVLQIKRFQQDHVCFLVQLLMCECQFLKAFMIEPKFLYIQMNMNIQEGDMSSDQIMVEGQILSVLRYSCNIIRQFATNSLSESSIMSEEFDSQKLIQKFQGDWLALIKKNFKETFQKRYND